MTQGKGRSAHNYCSAPEDRQARLFWALREALCLTMLALRLIMLATCEVAFIVLLQIYVQAPSMASACELAALTGLVSILLGAKRPPPSRA